METQGINLFIVDDDKLLVADLRNYLQNKFGGNLKISVFNDGETCLEKIDKDTHIIILDYCLDGKNGLEILKSIKEISPKVEVIMLSGNEDMAIAIEMFRAGAKDYVRKGVGSWGSITNLVNGIIIKPIRIVVKGFFG